MTTKKTNPLIILILISVLIFISIFVWNKFQVDNSEKITPIVQIEKPVKSNFRNQTIHKLKDANSEEKVEVKNKVKSEPFIPTKTDIKKMHNSYSFQVYLSRLQTPEKLVEALLKFENSGETEKANMVIDKLLLLYPDYELPHSN